MPPAQRKPPVKAVPRKPVAGANFVPKRERKRVRKSMVRAYLANRVAEVRVGAAQRAEFYRNLRMMKLRRIEIAKGMVVLSAMVDALQSRLESLGDRIEGSVAPTRTEDERMVLKQLLATADETADLARSAGVAVSTAAAEFWMFAKRRIYYTEVVG